MCWQPKSNCLNDSKIAIAFLFCFLPLLLFGKNKSIQNNDPSPEAWEMVTPYLMDDTHPLKKKLDALFSRCRLIQDQETLFKAGFDSTRLSSKVIVTRHPDMPGYVFKIYTDDGSCSQGRPDYKAWMLRARGAWLIRQEIAKMGWDAYFKAPIKWIYALPATPKAKRGHVQKNFILVEQDMGILPREQSLKRWRDGTITPQHLQMLFHILTSVGLRDCSKHTNIPICKDGRIAFIDTSGHGRTPFYDRLFNVLSRDLSKEWKRLIKESKKQG